MPFCSLMIVRDICYAYHALWRFRDAVATRAPRARTVRARTRSAACERCTQKIPMRGGGMRERSKANSKRAGAPIR